MIAVGCSSAATARAQDRDGFFEPGKYVLSGVSLAFWDEGEERNAMVGIELSYASFMFGDYAGLWQLGAYADVRYDQGARGVQVGLGVQGGWAVLVADAGLVVRLGQRSGVGVRARGCLASGVISFCAGGGITTASPFIEAAVLLKYPYRRDRRRRTPPESEPLPAAAEGPLGMESASPGAVTHSP